MEFKTVIVAPKQRGCVTHDKYIEECYYCRLLHKERLDAAKKIASDIAYTIVYDNWDNYLKAVRKPFKTDVTSAQKNMCEDQFVRDVKRNITKDLYPFAPGSARFCRSIWNAAIKDLSHRLFGNCPIITVKIGNKKKKVTLWY